LHKPEDRTNFRRRSPSSPSSPPDPELIARYHQIRRKREEINEKVNKDLFNKLKPLTMVSDGRLTERRRDRNFRNHKQAEKNFEEWGELDAFNKRFRFAAIGYRVKISKLPGNGYFGEELSAMPDPRRDAAVPGLGEARTEPAQLGRTRALEDARLRHWQD